MTFKEQTFWCRKWGAVVLLLGMALIGSFYLLADSLDRGTLKWLASLGSFGLFIAGGLMIFGGVARPIQKSFYHYAFEGNDRCRLLLVSNPIAIWLWIDAEGRDRDA